MGTWRMERPLVEPTRVPVIRYRRLLQGSAVPVASDPRWRGWCKPLLAFLRRGPALHYELETWAEGCGFDRDLMRQQLAWLSLHGLACFKQGRWMAIR